MRALAVDAEYASQTPISLSVFFPVYNERENLAELIERAVEVLEMSPLVGVYEVIIVDDGSTDGSAAIADAIARNHPNVRAVHHPENRGYGSALKTGMAEARMTYVFFTDADLQFDILELNSLLLHIPAYKTVIGYRAPRQDPFLRLVNAWGWNVLNRLLFGLAVRDIDCAFKVFDRALVQGIELRSEGAMISAETLIRLARAGVAIKEVPVSHAPRERGSPTGAKLSVIFRAFSEMLSLYRGELGRPFGPSEINGQLARFVLVGFINTLVDALLYILLTRAIGIFAVYFLAAKAVSFAAGTVSSLVLNRSWTFGVRTPLSLREVARFYGMVSLSFVVNVLVMNVLVRNGVYDLYALVLATASSFLVSFTLARFWVFQLSPVGRRPAGYTAA